MPAPGISANMNANEIKAKIASLQTPAGGWTRESLALFGIDWPPPAGWKKFLEEKGDSKVIYDKGRYPKQSQKKKCRGCGGDVPKGRISWCSRLCYNRYCPQMVKIAIRRRDNHVCQICKKDIRELVKEHFKLKPECSVLSPEYRNWMKEYPNEEYDHIIPFSEGGRTIIENMRTVCSQCHKNRTKEWHKSRKQKNQTNLNL